MYLEDIQSRLGGFGSLSPVILTAGNGDQVSLDSLAPAQAITVPQFKIPTFSIGSYTPSYQFSNPAQSGMTAAAASGFNSKSSMLIIAGFIGMGAAIYLAGKK